MDSDEGDGAGGSTREPRSKKLKPGTSVEPGTSVWYEAVDKDFTTVTMPTVATVTDSLTINGLIKVVVQEFPGLKRYSPNLLVFRADGDKHQRLNPTAKAMDYANEDWCPLFVKVPLEYKKAVKLTANDKVRKSLGQASTAQIQDCSAKYLRSFTQETPRLSSIEDLRNELLRELPELLVLGWIPPVDQSILPLRPCSGLETELPARISMAISTALVKTFPTGSEEDVATLAHFCTDEIWVTADGLTAMLLLESGKNLADRSGATLKTLRPDYCLWVKGVLLLKAEHKRRNDAFETAKQELTGKMACWNTIALGGIPFLPCYAQGGAWIQFFAITPKDEGNFDIHEVTDRYNLMDPTQRAMVIRVAMNMLRVLYALRQMLQSTSVKLYHQMLRKDGTSITIFDNYVRKICDPAPIEIYNLLGLDSSIAHVPCAISITQRTELQGGRVRLKITPVCLEVLPDSEESLRVAIKDVLTALQFLHQQGFVHRDVRWPNVLRNGANRWLLADFELAERKEVSVMPGLIAESNLPPECRGEMNDTYSTAGDIWQVGSLLMLEWTGTLSEAARQWAEGLTESTPSRRPSAAALLSSSVLWPTVHNEEVVSDGREFDLLSPATGNGAAA